MKENKTLENIAGEGTAENSAVRENVISPEDCERLDNLFERIGDNNLEYGFDENRRRLKAELQGEGIIGARYLLEKIAVEENTYTIFLRIGNLKICATPEVAQEIGALLVDDRVALDHDGSSVHMLIEILENVGTSLEAHFLVESIYKTAIGRSGIIEYDTLCVFDALRKILVRTKDLDGQAEVKKAMAEINAFRAKHHYGELSEKEENDEFEKEDDNFDTEHESDPFSDSETDKKFRDEYYEKNKMLSAVERLEIVKNLRIMARKEKDANADPEEPDDFLRRHFLEYKEKNPSPHGVTLGIEIEIPEKTVISKELREKEYTDDSDEYEDEYEKQFEKFTKSKEIDVPEGEDANQFWEFAHEPARNPLTIAREVQALIGMGLINKNYAKYPLHVTLGGISSLGNDGNQVHVLSHALEATGWSTNADRLTRPYRRKNGSWACKGKGSIQERNEEYQWV